ncbi:MAG: thioredoxin family protein [Pseudomonadota bacterium]
MKHRLSTITASAALILLLLVSAAGASESIKWQPYEKGISLAQEQGKEIFLYFYADWCTYCKKMEKETFTNDSVIQYINENFIPISINSDQNQTVASTFSVRGLPTFWLLKSDSTRLSNLPGYVDSERLMAILKYIKTASYEKMSFKDFVKTL